jgi:hypothetical protein
MSLDQHFHIRRFGMVLRNDFLQDRGGLLAAAGALALILLSLAPFLGIFSAFPFFVKVLYSPVLVIGGCLYTSLAFRSLATAETAISAVMVPASAGEKLLSRWLLTSLFYPFLLLSAMLLALQAGQALNLCLFRSRELQWVFYWAEWTRALPAYLVANAIFLCGSAVFRKNAFIKTALCVAAVWLIVAVIVVASKLQGWAVADGTTRAFQFGYQSGTYTALSEWVKRFVSFLLWSATPVCLIVTYRRLRTLQV